MSRVWKVNVNTNALIGLADQPPENFPFVKGDVAYLLEVRRYVSPHAFMGEYQNLVESEPQVEGDFVKIGLTAEWRPVDELRAIKKAEITIKRDQALSGGITWTAPDGAAHRIQSDATSRDNLTGTATGIAAGLPLPAGFSWRTADNIDVALDAAGLLSLAGAMLVHVNACWQVSWTKKAEIDALTDPADIAGYNATAGWPA